MRPTFWTMLALLAAASLTAPPARAQFAAEDTAALPADADGTYDESGYGQAGATADPYAETGSVDPAAADAAYGTLPPQSIGDRRVADVATSVLGAKGARQVQDAETIVRTVIGKVGTGGGPAAASGVDPVGLVQDILNVARKTPDPQ